MNTITTTLTFCSVFFFTLINAEDQKQSQSNLFEKTTEYYIRQYTSSSGPEKISIRADKLPNYKELKKQINKHFDYTELSQGNKLQTCYDLIKDKLNSEIKQTSDVSKQFELKTELVGNHSLIHILDRTQTAAGNLSLVKLLTSPTHEKDALHARQEIITQLVQNPDLLKKIRTSLKSTVGGETALLLSMQPHQKDIGDLTRYLYPLGGSVKALNKSSWGMQFLISCDHILRGLMWLQVPMTIFALNTWFKKKIHQDAEMPISNLEAVQYGVKGSLNLLNPFKTSHQENDLPIVDYAPSLGDLVRDRQEYSTKTKVGILLYGGLLAGSQAYTTYNLVQEFRMRNLALNHLHNQLIDIAVYTRTAKKLIKEVSHYPALQTYFEPMIRKALKGSDKFNLLLELLDTKTFDGASFFSMTGRILAARTLLVEVLEEFADLMTFVGLLDAYASCAQLYLDHQMPDEAKFCFAQYEWNASNPHIAIKDFWNPFINSSIVVPNSIELKACEKLLPQTILLTGPNTGGKSTIIKALLINVLLAQTIGIAPSTHFLITPFSTISCMLNITDDISNNVSMFQAEINAAKQLQNLIKSAEMKNEFSFTIMDELFHGTNPLEGAQAATLFTKNIGGLPNSICCVATHFQEVTKLELENPAFKNYHVKTYRDEQTNVWIKPYRLFEGPSEQTNALELLKDQGIF